MKKMKLSVKLIAGFLCVALIAALIGIVGIYYVKKIQTADMALYEKKTVPALAAGAIGSDSETSSALVKDYITSLDEGQRKGILTRFQATAQITDDNMKKIEDTLYSNEAKKIFAGLKESLGMYRKIANQIISTINAGDFAAAMVLQKGEEAAAKRLKEEANNLTKYMTAEAKKAAEETRRMAGISVAIASVLTLIGVLCAVGLGIFLTLMITRPINRIVAGMTDGAEQVAAASSQVSSSSQHLAEGASEQASSLEETSSSLEELSSMAKQNADNAGQAKSMMQEAKTVVDKANQQMAELIEAIGEITRSSEETGKIIKTIDEIAFQTNLLALNAAVEAARAGEAGAGFAVVADEVRNLAMRSAEAAKNTSELIEKTIKAVHNGNQLTVATQEAFKANADISGKVNQLVDEIATASDEQAHGVDQINTAVTEMDKVTQQTAANAEESASASEELNAQSIQMRGFVEELMAVVGGEAAAVSAYNAGRTAAPVKRRTVSPSPRAALKQERRKTLPGNARRNRPEELISFGKEDEQFKDF